MSYVVDSTTPSNGIDRPPYNGLFAIPAAFSSGYDLAIGVCTASPVSDAFLVGVMPILVPSSDPFYEAKM